MRGQNLQQIRYTAFFTRIIAYLIDIAILFIIGIFINTIILRNDDYSINMYVQYMLYFSYFIGMELSSLQATIGKFLMGLITIDTYEKRISSKKALIRGIIKVPLFPFFMLILTIPFTEKRQAIHDMIAKTIVIKKEYL
ncbi:MAG: RDD family protein [Methanomicrobiaceae archaeon]|nr:RDD family protein [Methanomicrobiaceae archaeon]